MRNGRWVKCIKTITEIFIEGKFYRISYSELQYPYITIIDELGNTIGFNVIEDSMFKNHFRIECSQKRKTKWATQKLP